MQGLSVMLQTVPLILIDYVPNRPRLSHTLMARCMRVETFKQGEVFRSSARQHGGLLY